MKRLVIISAAIWMLGYIGTSAHETRAASDEMVRDRQELLKDRQEIRRDRQDLREDLAKTASRGQQGHSE
jgi:hypothetical protein